MTGHDSGFRQAAARFAADVEQALTRARRAAREARSETADFRRRTEELADEAGKSRRRQAAPTHPDAQAEARKFRDDSGLPVSDLSASGDVTVQLPRPVVRPATADEFLEVQVLYDIDAHVGRDLPGQQRAEPEPVEQQAPPVTRAREAEDDFSQQRILMDAVVESYRPDELTGFDDERDDPGNRR